MRDSRKIFGSHLPYQWATAYADVELDEKDFARAHFGAQDSSSHPRYPQVAAH